MDKITISGNLGAFEDRILSKNGYFLVELGSKAKIHKMDD